MVSVTFMATDCFFQLKNIFEVLFNLCGPPKIRTISGWCHISEMITIRFAGWISDRIVSLQPERISNNCFKREPDTDPDIRNAFVDISRIQTFGKSCTLHNHSFIIFRSIFSAFSAMTSSLSMV